MIPIRHDASHLAYSKSARLYLDTMKKLPENMTEAQFRTFRGLVKIVILLGLETLRTIQFKFLIRMLKASGGLAHGRGVTDSTQTRSVHVMPRCIPICSYLESFCGVHTKTSDQHNDIRACSTSQDVTVYTSVLGWFHEHSPHTLLMMPWYQSLQEK